jgi:hypothetical protein
MGAARQGSIAPLEGNWKPFAPRVGLARPANPP